MGSESTNQFDSILERARRQLDELQTLGEETASHELSHHSEETSEARTEGSILLYGSAATLGAAPLGTARPDVTESVEEPAAAALVPPPEDPPAAPEDESNKHFDASSVSMDMNQSKESVEPLINPQPAFTDIREEAAPQLSLETPQPYLEAAPQLSLETPQPYLEAAPSLPLPKLLVCSAPQVPPQASYVSHDSSTSDVSAATQDTELAHADQDSFKKKKGFFKKLFAKKKLPSPHGHTN